jgi:hypothetical protein
MVGMVLFFSAAADASAAITLTVEPYDGSPSLSFGTINPAGVANPSGLTNKEVKVRINSDLSSQYRVFQRVFEPLANENGERLDGAGFTFYVLRGSNANGTVYGESPLSLSNSDQLIYSSSSPGDSDSMIFVYTIDASKLNAAGNFSGRLIYTLNSLTGNIKQEVYLNVFLNAAGEFKIETQSSSLGNVVELSSKDQSRSRGYAQVSFKGNFAGKIDIYQDIITLPVDESGREINSETVKVYSDNPAVGAQFRTPQTLSRRRVLLYSSQAGDDTIILNFIVDQEKISAQTAGIYRGKVRYVIVRNGREETADFDLQIEVAPVFTVDVSMPPEGMHFDNILPSSAPQFREVLVTVKTNLSKPYMVIQNSVSPLANEKGKTIESSFFAMKGEAMPGEPGEARFPDFTPVPAGTVPVFFSDAQGNGTKFKVIYRVKVSSLVSAGDYQAAFDYSLSAR